MQNIIKKRKKNKKFEIYINSHLGDRGILGFDTNPIINSSLTSGIYSIIFISFNAWGF